MSKSKKQIEREEAKMRLPEIDFENIEFEPDVHWGRSFLIEAYPNIFDKEYRPRLGGIGGGSNAVDHPYPSEEQIEKDITFIIDRIPEWVAAVQKDIPINLSKDDYNYHLRKAIRKRFIPWH